MASYFEIHDTSGLLYDPVRGLVSPIDQGEGPPAGFSGGIRAGGNEPSAPSCGAWASASDVGTTASVFVGYGVPADNAFASGIEPDHARPDPFRVVRPGLD
jgi:hypothetical protein